jgi:hypothetical protein
VIYKIKDLTYDMILSKLMEYKDVILEDVYKEEKIFNDILKKFIKRSYE